MAAKEKEQEDIAPEGISLPASAAAEKQPGPPAADVAHAASEIPKEVKRTRGLKLFDVWLYPIFTNGVVFAISVAATYLTGAGKWKKDTNGKILTEEVQHWWNNRSVTRNVYDGKHGQLGEFFYRRGEWLKGKYKQWSGGRMSDKTAGMWKLVTFSFVDGTFIAPFVAMFENRREKIGRWIDKKLGTLPEDEEAAYKAEPKQTWKTVFGGRFSTLAVVLATALTLNEVKIPAPKWPGKVGDWLRHVHFNNKVEANLNDMVLSNPGLAVGHAAENAGWFSKLAKKVNLPELFRVSFFEAFYTSVCTAGLYYGSRFFARLRGKKEDVPAAESAKPATDTSTKNAATPDEPFLHVHIPVKEEGKETRPATERYQLPATAESRLAAVQQQREKAEKETSPSPAL